MDMQEFIQWVKAEIEKRGWSQNEMARRAGLSSGGLSLVMTGQRGITSEICQGIARAFKIPEDEVFRRAGLLKRKSPYQEVIDVLAQKLPDKTDMERAYFAKELITRHFRGLVVSETQVEYDAYIAEYGEKIKNATES